MPSVMEFGSDGAGFLGALTSGIEELSANAFVEFTIYSKFVLPLDGFVFWVRTGKFRFQGSLHRATTRHQDEDQTIAINRLLFSTETDISEFNRISPDTMLVGEFQGMRFAFTQQSNFYQQAGLYHYVGDALYPPLSTQLVDGVTQLDTKIPIVSNSLPAWLQLKSYNPIWLAPFNPGITLYPSYAVPDNLIPPYGSVHIEPGQITALQASPSFDINTSHSQLTSERVRVSLYGCNNNVALDFLDLVTQYSRDTDAFGLMNMPTMRDEKRIQSEFVILAQKKTIDFQVSYIQTRINDIARQLILLAIASFLPQP